MLKGQTQKKPGTLLSPESWQAPDAPSKRITAKCTIKTYFFDLLSWGGPAFDLFIIMI